MISKVKLHSKTILGSATFKDSGILFIGIAISTILGFVFTIILARALTTFEFGLFITGLTFIQLTSDLFELGINPASLNFLSGASDENKKLYLKTSFLLKIVFTSISTILIFSLAVFISEFIFKSKDMFAYVQISSIGILLLMLITWLQTIFQSEKRFFNAMVVNTSTNVLRLGALIILLFLGIRNSLILFLGCQLILVVSCLSGFNNLKVSFLSVSEKLPIKKVLQFGIPVGGSFAAMAVYLRIDQILVFNISGPGEAAIYGVANRVASALIFGAMAFNSAIIPRFAAMHTADFPTYFKKTMLAAVGLTFASLFSIPLSVIFLPLVFGNKFTAAVQPFQILVVGMSFFILAAPINTAILYRFKKTHYSLILSLFSLALIWLLLNLLIPPYKSAGAAYGVSIMYGLQFLTSLVYFVWINRYEK